MNIKILFGFMLCATVALGQQTNRYADQLPETNAVNAADWVIVQVPGGKTMVVNTTNLLSSLTNMPGWPVTGGAGSGAFVFSSDFVTDGTNVSLTIPPSTNATTVYLSPQGNNSTAIKGVKAKPYQTLAGAVAAAAYGDTIYLESGTHDIGTNSLVLPDGVNIIGPGKILCAADLQESGPAIVPGDNSIIDGITIECDTNTIIPIYDLTHTGYWAAIGSFNQGGFTNVLIRNVKVTHALSDILYVDSTNRTEATVQGGDFTGYWDALILKNNTNHYWKFTGSRFAVVGPNPITGLGASGRIVSFEAVNDYGHAEFSGCSFNASGFASSAAFRILGGSIKLNGCVVNNYYSSSSLEDWSYLTGSFTYNGTNYSIGTMKADGAGITNVPFAALPVVPLTNGDARSITFSNSTGVTSLKFTAGFGATAPVFQQSSMDLPNGYAVNIDGTLNLAATRFAFDGAADFTGVISGDGSGLTNVTGGDGISAATGTNIAAYQASMVTNHTKLASMGFVTNNQSSVTFGALDLTTLLANSTYADGAGYTNATAVWGASGNLTNGVPAMATTATYVSTATLTNQVYGSNVVNGVLTNAINTGVIPLGKATYTNITGNITIAGFSGVDPNVWQTGNLIATNSTATDYKITFAANCDVATNSFVLGRDVWVTNKSKVIIAIGLNQVLGTNVAAVRFPQR